MTAIEAGIIELAAMLDELALRSRPPLVKRLPLITAIRKLDAHVKIALKELNEKQASLEDHRATRCQGKPVTTGVVGQTVARCDDCGGWAELAANGNWSRPHVEGAPTAFQGNKRYGPR